MWLPSAIFLTYNALLANAPCILPDEIVLAYKVPTVAPEAPILPADTKEPTCVAAEIVPLNWALAAVIVLAYKVPTVAPEAPILPADTKVAVTVPAETVPLICAFADVIVLA